jgi:hypothetical protein
MTAAEEGQTVSDPDNISLDYLLVADSADVVNGKLYLLGGGWDNLKVPHLPGPPTVPFSVAVGIDVPWSLTNQKLRFSVDVLDADGGEVVELVGGEFEVGRPPGLRAGTPQRFQLTVPAQPQFGVPGRYVIRCSVNGVELGHTAIEVSSAQAGS